MIFNIITIFPKIFDSYFNESILVRAQKKSLIDIKVHNLRDYAKDKHQTVDDTPYGGGAGMLLKVEPIFNCVEAIKENFQFPILPTGRQVSNFQSNINDKIFNEEKTEKNKQNNERARIILFSAKGKKYTQADAQRLSQYKNLILICGRYEGVDERVAEYIIDEEFSVGEYVLTGGELPAMIVVDSVSRLLPGVLGNEESLSEESFSLDDRDKKIDLGDDEDSNCELENENCKFTREYPHYTKPEEFNGWKVPAVLLSGNHKEIEKWKKENRGK